MLKWDMIKFYTLTCPCLCGVYHLNTNMNLVSALQFVLPGLDNVPGSEHFIGSFESLLVCRSWRADGVESGRGERGPLLLAAVDGRGTAGSRDGNHIKIHTQRRMEMVIMTPMILFNPVPL